MHWMLQPTRFVIVVVLWVLHRLNATCTNDRSYSQTFWRVDCILISWTQRSGNASSYWEDPSRLAGLTLNLIRITA